MSHFRKRLPPVNALVVFEAVARHLSFTAAARELGVSQAATSRQVLILESHLDVRLFDRARKRIRLTKAGERLYHALSMSLNHLAGITDDLRRDGRRNGLTVATSIAFSAFWLMPRLTAFHTAHPDVELRLVTSDSDADLFAAEVDVAVVYGSGQEPGRSSRRLFGDEVIAVAQPGYFYARPMPTDVAGLMRETLLHLESDQPTWLTWADWLERCGAAVTGKLPGPQFNNYAITIQAASDGRGVALGWRRLLQQQIESGRLAQVLPATIVPEAAYHLLTPDKRRQDATVRAFETWMTAEARRDWT